MKRLFCVAMILGSVAGIPSADAGACSFDSDHPDCADQCPSEENKIEVYNSANHDLWATSVSAGGGCGSGAGASCTGVTTCYGTGWSDGPDTMTCSGEGDWSSGGWSGGCTSNTWTGEPGDYIQMIKDAGDHYNPQVAPPEWGFRARLLGEFRGIIYQVDADGAARAAACAGLSCVPREIVCVTGPNGRACGVGMGADTLLSTYSRELGWLP